MLGACWGVRGSLWLAAVRGACWGMPGKHRAPQPQQAPRTGVCVEASGMPGRCRSCGAPSRRACWPRSTRARAGCTRGCAWRRPPRAGSAALTPTSRPAPCPPALSALRPPAAYPTESRQGPPAPAPACSSGRPGQHGVGLGAGLERSLEMTCQGGGVGDCPQGSRGRRVAAALRRSREAMLTADGSEWPRREWRAALPGPSTALTARVERPLGHGLSVAGRPGRAGPEGSRGALLLHACVPGRQWRAELLRLGCRAVDTAAARAVGSGPRRDTAGPDGERSGGAGLRRVGGIQKASPTGARVRVVGEGRGGTVWACEELRGRGDRRLPGTGGVGWGGSGWGYGCEDGGLWAQGVSCTLVLKAGKKRCQCGTRWRI